MFKNLTPFIVTFTVTFVAAFLLGLVYQRVQVEDDCAKLGGFYFGNNVYQCYTEGKK